MEPSANKSFVAKGSGIILFIAIIVVSIWFIVRKANSHAAATSGNGKDSVTNTDTTQSIPADSTNR